MDNVPSLAYPFLFLGRRLVFILLLIGNDTQVQLIRFQVIQVLMIAYLGFARPFKETRANRSEIAREAYLLSLAYFMPICTEYVADP